MSGSNPMAALLPFILGAILVGGAVIGSRLVPARRHGVEMYFLGPLSMTLAGVVVWLFVERGDWLSAGIFAVLGLLVVRRIWRRRGDVTGREEVT